MDQVDRTLLEALRANARVSYAELSRAVGLSAPAVQERVRRLEAAGVITGYHAAVAPASLGLGVSALVSIYQTDSAEQEEVSDRLAEVHEVDNCWFVAGDEAFVRHRAGRRRRRAGACAGQAAPDPRRGADPYDGGAVHQVGGPGAVDVGPGPDRAARELVSMP